jgi:hypothetical protein
MENPDPSAHAPLLFVDEPEWSEAEFWSDGAPVAPAPEDPAAAAVSQYVSGESGGFNVQVDFAGDWSGGLQAAFIQSAERISDLIRSDISDVSWQGESIDDIHISAQLVDIDGAGSILGRAGPTAIRTADYLPATAVMEFDRADADAYNAHGLWDDIVLHEMMHSIGYGTIWDYRGLVSGAGTERPLFTGADATLTYNALYHVNRAGVPLETTGGPGTRDAHWDEGHFTSELMTGYVDQGGTYVSPLTVASLEDLGYDTTWTAASYLIA